MNRTARRINPGIVGTCGALTMATFWSPAFAERDVPEATVTLEELIALPEARLAEVDIAAMNLAAAAGLPGSSNVDRTFVLSTLDDWARMVSAVTVARAPVFWRDPGYFDHSAAKFCLHELYWVLQSLGVHYNVDQRTNPSLADSSDQFIHGIVRGSGGTCASLPVAYVAVGRRLGYPLKLVQGFSHYYVRWEDPETGECFNMEGSSAGLDFPEDEFYREQSVRLNPEWVEGGNYLRSMTPREELSAFLTTRADCLLDNGFLADANRTYHKAVEIGPRNRFALGLRDATGRTLERIRTVQQAEAMFQRQQRRLRRDPRVMVPGMPAVPAAHPINGRHPVYPPTSEAVLRRHGAPVPPPPPFGPSPVDAYLYPAGGSPSPAIGPGGAGRVGGRVDRTIGRWAATPRDARREWRRQFANWRPWRDPLLPTPEDHSPFTPDGRPKADPHRFGPAGVAVRPQQLIRDWMDRQSRRIEAQKNHTAATLERLRREVSRRYAQPARMGSPEATHGAAGRAGARVRSGSDKGTKP